MLFVNNVYAMFLVLDKLMMSYHDLDAFQSIKKVKIASGNHNWE